MDKKKSGLIALLALVTLGLGYFVYKLIQKHHDGKE